MRKQSAKIERVALINRALDPLYLFGCGLLWSKAANSGAGWELVRCLRSSRQNAQIAAALLARAEDIQQSGPAQKRSAQAAPAKRSSGANASKAVVVNDEYSVWPGIIENCVSLQVRKDQWFCGLSAGVLKSFSAASHLSTYPGDAVLFVEGQMPRGGWCCVRQVKLSTTSRDGKVRSSKWPLRGKRWV